MYKKNLFLNNLSHTVQREIINSYAKNNNLYCSVEETEIHGVDHYPHLEFYISKSPIKDIIFTSIFCLPIKTELRDKYLRNIINNNITLHFALEDKTTKNLTIEKINKYYNDVNRLCLLSFFWWTQASLTGINLFSFESHYQLPSS